MQNTKSKMQKKKRLFLWLFLLGLAAFLLAYKLSASSPLEIIEFINGRIVESPYPFYYQDTEHLKAKLLRAKVEPAVKGISSEWEKLIAIRKWVKSQWEHGEPQFNTWDALALLDLARKGNRFWCSQYSIVYVQCCAVLGLPARHIELYTKDLTSHAVTEVWSNDWNKWVVMDVDYNCYYVKDNLPLSALELHHAWLNKEANLVKIERDGTITKPVSPISRQLLSYYYHLFYIFRSDFLTLEVPEEPTPLHKIPGNNPQWIDILTPPLNFVSLRTDKVSDLYYTLNQTKINLAYRKSLFKLLPKQTYLKVRLTHNMPSFDRYLVRIDKIGAWQESSSSFEWSIKKGLNTLAVKARNKAGVDGPISKVVLRLN